MRGFIQEEWFNSFSTLLIINYGTDVNGSKIFFLVLRKRFMQQFLCLSYAIFEPALFFFMYLLHNLDRVMMALLGSLDMNSPWFACNYFFFTGVCLFKTSIKMFKKLFEIIVI